MASYFYLFPKLVQTSKTTEYKNVVITLERTACYGTCPDYRLTIYGDGRIVYEGKKFVEVTGLQTAQLSQDKIKQLINEFSRIDYFSLKDEYTESVPDLPTTITSITINGKAKKVVNYHGAPKKLDELENKIDEITNSKSWVWE